MINEQFLISKGWIKRGKRRFQLGNSEYYIKTLNEFGTSDKNMMYIYEEDTHDGTLFFGLTPTKEEYEILIKLLDI